MYMYVLCLHINANCYCSLIQITASYERLNITLKREAILFVTTAILVTRVAQSVLRGTFRGCLL